MPKKTPLLQLMHDISGPTNRIKSLLPLIETEPKSSDRAQLLSMIKRSVSEIDSALDTYYNISKDKSNAKQTEPSFRDGNGY